MESRSFIQTLNQKSPMFKHATTLEDVLCFTVMTANGNFLEVYNVDEARSKWLESFHGDCQECPYFKACTACFINERDL
jgi:hypothetical protein